MYSQGHARVMLQGLLVNVVSFIKMPLTASPGLTVGTPRHLITDLGGLEPQQDIPEPRYQLSSLLVNSLSQLLMVNVD